MTAAPIPVEIALDSGIVLRGLEYSQDGPPVVMIHDVGDDADSWSALPRLVSSRGYRVIVLELPGHGLSDGEPGEADLLADVGEALEIIGQSFGPLAVAAYGSAATNLLLMGDQVAPVHLLVSPLPVADFDPDRTRPAMRAVFSGTQDPVSDEFFRSVYPRLLGQNMWFSTGSADSGVELLEGHPSMVDQLVTFVRRYLVGHHLAWIAEQQDSDDQRDQADPG